MSAFAATFLVLVAAGVGGMRHLPALAFAHQEVPSVRGPDPSWFPVFFRGGTQLDHTLLWNGIGPFEENARRADVVFVGTSQMQFALPPHELRAFAKRSGLFPFTLGLPFSERYTFALRLIEKLDVKPRVVVANAAAFFLAGESLPAHKAVRDGHWTGLATVWEEELAAIVWPTASRIFPSFVTRRPAQSLLRSSTNGAWMPIQWPHRHLRVKPGPLDVDLAAARRFRNALAARGIELVLICVPTFVGNCTPDALQQTATALGVSAVVPRVDGQLWTGDAAHLCPLSGKRFGRALLRDVGNLDVLRAIARRPRPPRATDGR